MGILSILISVVALLLSGLSLFMQFFYHPRRLRAITMPISRDSRFRFGICNDGKESVYITGLSVDYSVNGHGELTKTFPVGDVRGAAMIVNPGSIVEFSYVVKDPPDSFLQDAKEPTSNGGKTERTVDIIASIQFAYPNGKVFSNRFTAGAYIMSEKSRTTRVYGVNLDLLKLALPVLDEKSLRENE